MLAIKDPNNNSITAVYDPLGRRTSSIDPNQGARTFEYNGLGEVVWQRDARGWQSTFIRDVLGRVESRAWFEPLGAAQHGVSHRGEDTFTYGIKGTEVINSETGVRVQFRRPETPWQPWGQVLF